MVLQRELLAAEPELEAASTSDGSSTDSSNEEPPLPQSFRWLAGLSLGLALAAFVGINVLQPPRMTESMWPAPGRGTLAATVEGLLVAPRGATPGEVAAAIGAPVLRGRGRDESAEPEPSQDCFAPCGGAGLCEGACGQGHACCRRGELGGPVVCKGAVFNTSEPEVPYHICVPVKSEYAMLAWLAPSSVEPVFGAAPASVPKVLPQAPLHRFYLYRAQNEKNYPLGNVNVGNLPGVMWYLANEVMPRCPRRYDITRIKRMLITTRATPELFARGMNFGVRYSYDSGRCTGSNIRLLGSCDRTWSRFGYVPGCNNFKDHYPYPLVDTEYPDGVWYDFPLEGRCDHPTGDWNCTWSYEEAGEIHLADLEAEIPGYAYCCGGNCTNFWLGKLIPSNCERRLNQAYDMFARKYPDMAPDMPAPACDFERQAFWK